MLLRIATLIRALVLTPFFILHTAICGSLVLLSSLLYPNRWFFDLILGGIWPRPMLWLAGITLELRGAENIPKDRGFLYIFNHTSYVDIFAIVAGLPAPPRFGAKIELFSVPIFGPAMAAVGVLKIARNDRSGVLKIYEKAAEKVAQGEFYALAPEGTRQTQKELGRFKTGPFIFGIQAKMPVVPLVIAGAKECMPKGAWLMNVRSQWNSKVIVQILPPLEGEKFNMDTLNEFQGQARELMSKAYESLNLELSSSK